jgi:polyhydroxyalkanoate synthesis regulator phasin
VRRACPSRLGEARAGNHTVMSGIRDVARRAVFGLVGAAALTHDRASEVVNDLVERGMEVRSEAYTRGEVLIDDEGPALARSAAAAVGIEEAMHRLLREVGIAPHEDVNGIGERISDLEHRVGVLEGPPAGRAAGGVLALWRRTTTVVRRERQSPDP